MITKRVLDLLFYSPICHVFHYDHNEGTKRCKFIFSRIKKGEGQGKEKCHSKSMMSKEANERLKRDTQHVPLSH
jgi:hypothetical protein